MKNYNCIHNLTPIPDFIRQSLLFDEAELDLLASLGAVPSAQEIDEFQYEPEIQELLNAFIGDEQSRLTHQLLKAKEFLQTGDLVKAWKIALI